jgi:hypothetical protein
VRYVSDDVAAALDQASRAYQETGEHQVVVADAGAELPTGTRVPDGVTLMRAGRAGYPTYARVIVSDYIVFEAVRPGSWANNMSLEIIYGTSNSVTLGTNARGGVKISITLDSSSRTTAALKALYCDSVDANGEARRYAVWLPPSTSQSVPALTETYFSGGSDADAEIYEPGAIIGTAKHGESPFGRYRFGTIVARESDNPCAPDLTSEYDRPMPRPRATCCSLVTIISDDGSSAWHTTWSELNLDGTNRSAREYARMKGVGIEWAVMPRKLGQSGYMQASDIADSLKLSGGGLCCHTAEHVYNATQRPENIDQDWYDTFWAADQLETMVGYPCDTAAWAGIADTNRLSHILHARPTDRRGMLVRRRFLAARQRIDSIEPLFEQLRHRYYEQAFEPLPVRSRYRFRHVWIDSGWLASGASTTDQINAMRWLIDMAAYAPHPVWLCINMHEPVADTTTSGKGMRVSVFKAMIDRISMYAGKDNRPGALNSNSIIIANNGRPRLEVVPLRQIGYMLPVTSEPSQVIWSPDILCGTPGSYPCDATIYACPSTASIRAYYMVIIKQTGANATIRNDGTHPITGQTCNVLELTGASPNYAGIQFCHVRTVPGEQVNISWWEKRTSSANERTCIVTDFPSTGASQQIWGYYTSPFPQNQWVYRRHSFTVPKNTGSVHIMIRTLETGTVQIRDVKIDA